MKRKIALLLALVMVLSMVPMMSFAASGNTKTAIIGGVPRIADNHDSQDGNTFTKVNSLRIEEDYAETGSNENFQLRIENAKWSSKDVYKTNVTGNVYQFHGETQVRFTITSRTDKVLDIRLEEAIDKNAAGYFQIPLFFKADGNGPVKVTIDPVDSSITGGTFTVANASKGATVTTIDDKITFSEKGELDPVRIEETTMGALGKGEHRIKLRLPSNFEWTTSKNGAPKVEFINGFNKGTYDDNTKTVTGGNIALIPGTMEYDTQRDLEFSVFVGTESGARGVILIKDTAIYATSNAKEGDVEVRISGGDVTSETITVGKYSDFDVTVKADGEPTKLISGRFEATDRDGKYDSTKQSDLTDKNHELQTLIIEEEVEDALLNNRRTKVEFPSWVKILGVKVDTTDVNGVDFHGVVEESGKAVIDITKDTLIFDDKNRDASEIEFTIDANTSKESKVELTFYVSVKADAEGDIVAKVSGRAGAEGEVVLGETRRAVDLEIKGKTTMLELGKKGQAIPEIIISEIEDEDLMDGNLILNLSNDAAWGSYKVEVIEGDLEVDHDNIDDNEGNLIIPIKKSGISTKPSTIKVSNASIDMKRMAADGDVNVRVRGAAVRRNHKAADVSADSNSLDAGYFDQNNVVSAKVAELLHGNYREPGLVTQEVVLTIGSKTIFVDGVEETANAAPYIDSANRTMLPVSAIGRALGAKVEWNDAARTVLVTKGNTRALLTIGKDVMNVNGMEIPMRSKAVITNERTFVPLKDLGVALGVNVEWDAATRTVTIK